MFENQLNKLRLLQPLLQAVNQEAITAQAKFLYDRISNPDSYLVFLGETSSGKTSMINGLLGDHVLPVKAIPTTATITEVELCNDIPEDEYYAINKDATLEDLTLSQFKELCLKPTETLARLKIRHKITYSSKGLANLRIFDTPGYGSIIKEHEEVLKEFLPNSDVIVYTVNYVAGIKESDYTFLRFLKELVRDDVKFLLLINMCPTDAAVGDDVAVLVLDAAELALHALLGPHGQHVVLQRIRHEIVAPLIREHAGQRADSRLKQSHSKIPFLCCPDWYVILLD